MVSVSSTAELELQPIGPDSGSTANTFNPLFPLILNLMGIARPAFTEFRAGRLFTGAKNPAKRYRTETVNEHDTELPAMSVAITVMGVVPTANSDPEDGVVVTIVFEQLSLVD